MHGECTRLLDSPQKRALTCENSCAMAGFETLRSRLRDLYPRRMTVGAVIWTLPTAEGHITVSHIAASHQAAGIRTRTPGRCRRSLLRQDGPVRKKSARAP